MWACLQDHDTSGHWKQVAGWRKVCDLAMNHMRRLHEYRRGLAEAWPPETNAAARAYLAELDQLIEKVQRTHDTAAANHDALAAATRAIDSARPQVKTLYEQYSTKLAQKRSYEEMITDPKALAGNRTTKPPVTDADLEQLNSRARGIMFGLSGELQQAQVMLRQPPQRAAPKSDQQFESSSGAGAAPPIIPPIMPVPISTSNPTSPAKRSATPLHSAHAPTAPNVGPVLGGANSSVITPSTPSPMPGTGLPSMPQQGVGLPPTLPSAPPPSTSSRPGSSAALRGQTGHLPSSGGQPPHNAPSRFMQPGGLIGSTPGTGPGQHGNGTQSRRINPVGGVIGGGAAGTAPTGAAGSRPGTGRTSPLSPAHGMSPIGGSPGFGSPQGIPGRPSRREQEGDSGRWDPDNPWATREGVDPVVRPPDEDGPIDPGPAIGFSR
ncbi:hypothetical protein GA0070560_103199 [Micromonospora halophytica]|uniref:Uncharacterized protein n=1 Tax=Micromonospora halophytica TaxID=47864 RepID=A0A1C5H6X4_9ACTN|nr:hypothetical protein GA0070560_103199 [Micromonospora halophytica]